MRVLTLFTAILLVFVAVSALIVSADANRPEDYRCHFCTNFVRRVIVENESPITACSLSPISSSLSSSTPDISNGCGFMLKQHKLISELSSLRDEYNHEKRKLENIKNKKHFDRTFFRTACIQHTSNKVIVGEEDADDQPLCPRFEDTFEDKLLYPSSNGFDLRVSPPSMWMSPNTIRLTVIDNNFNGTEQHFEKFLKQFSYNENYKYFATEKVVHTGLFPVVPGKVSYIVLGFDDVVLPINLPKQGSPVRGVLTADPCWANTYMHCPYGAQWKVLPRLTQLLNTLADKKEKDAIHFMTMLGDNGYDEPEGKILPQLYTNLNAAAVSLPSFIAFGNHDGWAMGGCSAAGFSGPNPKGATTIQYSGQNVAANADPANAAKNPFNWTGFNTSDYKTPAAASNFFSAGMIGNLAYIQYSGANTLEETLPYFKEACQFIKEKKPAWTMIMSHWSGENCNCAPGMSTPNVYELIVTLDGCKEVASTIKFIQGHSHQNVVVKANTGFTVGGFGMNDDPATFGIPFVDTFNDRIQMWNFHIAYANETGDDNWSALMDCVNQQGGLHQCTNLAELWLDQPTTTSN